VRRRFPSASGTGTGCPGTWGDRRAVVRLDWEHSGANVPVGSICCTSASIAASSPSARASPRAAERSRAPGWTVAGPWAFTAARADVAFRLYLLEAFLRYHEPSIAGRDATAGSNPEAAIQIFEGASPALAGRT